MLMTIYLEYEKHAAKLDCIIQNGIGWNGMEWNKH